MLKTPFGQLGSNSIQVHRRLQPQFHLFQDLPGQCPDLFSEFCTVERGDLMANRKAGPRQAASARRNLDYGGSPPPL